MVVYKGYFHCLPFLCYREMYHGTRWMNHSRFQVPMITCSFGQVYVGDFILFCDSEVPRIARVKQFFCQVSDHIFPVTAWVYIHVKQEEHECVFVRVQPLHHQRDDTYNIMPSVIIQDSAILSSVAAPTSVLRWDKDKSSFVLLSDEVLY